MAGFAGSHAVDERRRRRLATESEESAVEALSISVPKRTSQKPTSRQRGPNQFPLRKLISARWWKLSGVGLLGYLVAAAILAGGYCAELCPGRIGPGAVRLLDLQNARLVNGYLTAALFLSGQLALLIGWLRSQSMRDFDGRYRGWTVCACVAFGAAFAVQTGAVTAWSETAGWIWKGDFWKKAALAWIVPALLCGVVVLRFLSREMRGSRLGKGLLLMAALLFLGCAGLSLAQPLTVSPLGSRLVESAIAMAAAWSLFTSFLFHARHVIYISVEPPADRPSLLTAFLRRLRPWTIFSTSQKRGASRGAAAQRSKRRRRKPAAQPEPPTKPADQDAEKRALHGNRPSVIESQPAIFAGIDPAAALSRRERRLLKKQMHEQQQSLRRSA